VFEKFRYFEKEKVTLSVTVRELHEAHRSEDRVEPVGISAGRLELARGIEPPTGGLQNRCSAD
jgi:hypothetical protein